MGLFVKTGELKPLLYTLRVLATGTHLMREGEVEADLTRLLAYSPPYTEELIAAKRGAEHGALPSDGPDLVRLELDVSRMTAVLEEACGASRLPESSGAFDAVDALVVGARLG